MNVETPVEEWRPITDYEHVYAISNYGRVMRIAAGKGTHAGRILATTLSSTGYPIVFLRDNGRDKRALCHRLVAAAFIGDAPTGYDVNHIDGVKTNNWAGNLEYMTRKENIQHAFRLGLSTGTKHLGTGNPAAKLTEEDVRSIRAECAANAHAAYRLAKQYSVTYRTIWLIAHHHTWKHVS